MNDTTLYISDLDGTLLDSESKVSAESVTLLNHAIARGALFSVATARTPATVSRLLADVNVGIPLVVMTGAALWDKATGRYSDVQYFPATKVREVTEAYKAVPSGAAFLYTLKAVDGGADVMEIYHIGEMNGVERGFMMERISSPYKRFIVPHSGVSDIPPVIDNAVLFFGMNPEAAAREILGKLMKIDGINPMFYHDWYADAGIAEVEAFPAGATKAKAIRRLKAKVGAKRVVVFGDNMNDLSMMEAADWSVAVANAVPEVKAAADEVIGSNDADSVARYILQDLEINSL